MGVDAGVNRFNGAIHNIAFHVFANDIITNFERKYLLVLEYIFYHYDSSVGGIVNFFFGFSILLGIMQF